MAKPTSRAGVSRSAAQSAAKKRSTARAPGKSSSAKTLSRNKTLSLNKTLSRNKSSPRKPAASKARAAAAPKPRRPKQRVAISHYRDEDFQANGLRTYAHYRDLGIAGATDGLAQAHVIRLIGPCDPKEVSKLHFHDVEFQMVYVLKGWVKTYMEGQGETLMKEGSAWTQPPRIRHLILDYSDHCELLEVILPAEFKTVELAD
jgi:hypothetical protein